MNNSTVALPSGTSVPTAGAELFAQTKYTQANDAFSFQTAFETQFESQGQTIYQTDVAQDFPQKQTSMLSENAAYKDKLFEKKSTPVQKKEAKSSHEDHSVNQDDNPVENSSEVKEEDVVQGVQEEQIQADDNKPEKEVTAEEKSDNATEQHDEQKTAKSEKDENGDAQQAANEKQNNAGEGNGKQQTAGNTAENAEAVPANVKTNNQAEAAAESNNVQENSGSEKTEQITANEGDETSQVTVDKNETPTESKLQQPESEQQTQASTTTAESEKVSNVQTTTDELALPESETVPNQDQVKVASAEQQQNQEQQAVDQQAAETAAQQTEYKQADIRTESELQEQPVQAEQPTAETSASHKEVSGRTDGNEFVQNDSAKQALELKDDGVAQEERVAVENQQPTAKQAAPTSQPKMDQALTAQSQSQERHTNVETTVQNNTQQTARQGSDHAGQELPVDPDVKVKSLNIENTDIPEGEEPIQENLLKKLVSTPTQANQGRHVPRQAANNQSGNQQQDLQQQQGQQNWAENFQSQNKKQLNFLNGLFQKSKEAVANNKFVGKARTTSRSPHAAVNLDTLPASNANVANAAKMNSAVFSNGTTLKNVALIQELMGRIQGMLKGTATPGSKLTMDFTSSNLGQMSLDLQQKDGSLTVTLDVSDDSTKQQLMNQRDELAAQLRQMGFKQVAVNVSTGNENFTDQQKQSQQQEGNANIENVRLAGDDEMDLAQILSYNFNS